MKTQQQVPNKHLKFNSQSLFSPKSTSATTGGNTVLTVTHTKLCLQTTATPNKNKIKLLHSSNPSIYSHSRLGPLLLVSPYYYYSPHISPFQTKTSGLLYFSAFFSDPRCFLAHSPEKSDINTSTQHQPIMQDNIT